MNELRILPVAGKSIHRMMDLDAEIQHRLPIYSMRSPMDYAREYRAEELGFMTAVDMQTHCVYGFLRWRGNMDLSQYPSFLPEFEWVKQHAAIDIGGYTHEHGDFSRAWLHAQLVGGLALSFIGRSEGIVYAQVREEMLGSFVRLGFEQWTAPFIAPGWKDEWIGIGTYASRLVGRPPADREFGFEMRDLFRNTDCKHMRAILHHERLLEIYRRPRIDLAPNRRLILPWHLELQGRLPAALPHRHEVCRNVCVRSLKKADVCHDACWLQTKTDR